MDTTPIYGWRTPSSGEVADGPAAMKLLAGDIETTFASTLTNAYTPSWTASVENPVNPAARIGRYRVQNGFCQVMIWLTFGSSTGGGRGDLYLSLPVPGLSSLPEQVLQAKFWVPNTGTFNGFALIRAATNQRADPIFPDNIDTTIHHPWRTSTDGADPTKGIPKAASSWNIQSGGNLLVSGRYAVA